MLFAFKISVTIKPYIETAKLVPTRKKTALYLALYWDVNNYV